MRLVTDVFAVERVRLAYARQMMTPIRGSWIGIRCEAACACPASVVAIDEGLEPEALRAAELDTETTCSEVIGRHLDVDPAHVRAFADGFDGKRLGCSLNAHHQEAHEHGRAVAHALWGPPS